MQNYDPLDPTMPHHWIYNIVPRHRSLVHNPVSWWLWTTFGNDEDGVLGERIPAMEAKFGEELSFHRFLCAQARNPFANFMKVTIAWPPRDTVNVLYSWVEGENIFRGRHLPFTWFVQWSRPTPRQFNLVAWPPMISWKGKRSEGYFGWHGDPYYLTRPIWFGIAVRFF